MELLEAFAVSRVMSGGHVYLFQRWTEGCRYINEAVCDCLRYRHACVLHVQTGHYRLIVDSILISQSRDGTDASLLFVKFAFLDESLGHIHAKLPSLRPIDHRLSRHLLGQLVGLVEHQLHYYKFGRCFTSHFDVSPNVWSFVVVKCRVFPIYLPAKHGSKHIGKQFRFWQNFSTDKCYVLSNHRNSSHGSNQRSESPE